MGRWVERIMHRMIISELLKDLGIKPADLRKLQQKLEDDLIQDPAKNSSNSQDEATWITVEQHGDTLFAYRKADGQFLGQGHSAEEVKERIQERFGRDHKWLILREDGGELLQKNNT